MTGAINRYYNTASNDPVLKISSNDKDVRIFEVGHGTSAGTIASCAYTLVYKGTGSSPNNSLQLQTCKGTLGTYTAAITIDENGKVKFEKQIEGIIDTAATTEHVLKFTNVKASGANAPAANNYVSFDGSDDITISTKTIGAINSAGDTMVGTLYFANGTTYYISDAGSAKFKALDATDATNLASTLKVTGATTLSSTLAVTGATTLNSTLTVKNTATMYNVVPADNNTSYSLGSTSAHWKALYIGSNDSYGSDSQPIWWSDGKPATCTSYANAAVKSAGQFTSAQSITLTGDTTGSASSTAGWSIATTTSKVSAHADSTTWRAQNDGPYTDLYKRHIVFDGLKNNANIGAPTTDVTYSHVITISGWSDWSGGPTSQLAFHTNGISTRNAKNANEWNDWMNVVRADKTGAGASTTPVWIDATGKAVPCAQVDVPTMWRKNFSISLTAATTSIDSVIQNSTFTEDMQVIQVVVTAGGERLTSPITWSFLPYPNSTDRVDLHLQFTCETADAATTLAGYVFIARVVTL